MLLLARGLSVLPGHADTWMKRGDILQSLSRPSEALASYCTAADASPHTRMWKGISEGGITVTTMCLTRGGIILKPGGYSDNAKYALEVCQFNKVEAVKSVTGLACAGSWQRSAKDGWRCTT